MATDLFPTIMCMPFKYVLTPLASKIYVAIATFNSLNGKHPLSV